MAEVPFLGADCGQDMMSGGLAAEPAAPAPFSCPSITTCSSWPAPPTTFHSVLLRVHNQTGCSPSSPRLLIRACTALLSAHHGAVHAESTLPKAELPTVHILEYSRPCFNSPPASARPSHHQSLDVLTGAGGACMASCTRRQCRSRGCKWWPCAWGQPGAWLTCTPATACTETSSLVRPRHGL